MKYTINVCTQTVHKCKPQYRNFVHPSGLPGKAKALGVCIVLSWFYTINVFSQIENLKDIKEYEYSVKLYYNKLWTAKRAEFKNTQKRQLWSFVPHIGITFGFPSIILNTTSIAQYYRNKNMIKSKVRSLDLEYKLMLNENIKIISIEYEKIKIQAEKAELEQSLLEIKKKIFTLVLEGYNKNEIKPIDYYHAELDYQQMIITYNKFTRDIKIQVLELEKIAHYNLTEKELAISESDCILTD